MPEKQVESYTLTYDRDWVQKLESREHWGFYWCQAKLVEDFSKKSDLIVELGVGSGFLQNYLKSRGWKALSVDIDESKQPDFVSDASQFDFSSISPDCLIAFEVFEHIPFPLFKRVVRNITRSAPKTIIFSVPLSVRYFLKMNLKLPKVREFNLRAAIPKKKILTKNHFWELDMLGRTEAGVLDGSKKGVVGFKDVKGVFGDNGYSVEQVSSEGRAKFFVAKPLG